uniref:Uncharacterized protein n=1 Tax=Trichinella nativa TaxID=6335 RepID=A0A0V1KH26_9BILA
MGFQELTKVETWLYSLTQGSTSMDFCLKNLSMTYTRLI